MKFQAIYSETARSDLHKLPGLIVERILEKIDFWIKQKNPLNFAKALQGVFRGRYRFRVGDYRIIFKLGKNGEIIVLFILRIQHRREVYRV